MNEDQGLVGRDWKDLYYVSSPHSISTDLIGEVVILDLHRDLYFGMDEVGAFIWERIQKGISGQALRDELLSEFDVEPERCERDLAALLGDLRKNGLIEVRGETVS
jgi:hypothetical protein